MTLQNITTYFIVPAFFFLAAVALVASFMSILAGLSTDPSFLVLGCIAFILGYNSFVFGIKLRKGER